MVNRHFLKAVIMFTGLIALGLLGVFLLSYFEEREEKTKEAPAVREQIDIQVQE